MALTTSSTTQSPFGNTTRAPFPAPAFPADSLAPDRRTALLATLAEGVSDALALFDYPGLRPVYFNAAALTLFLPTRAGDPISSLTLRDFVGVGFASRLESEVLVHARVLGRWSGDCTLRDEWGCEHPASAVFSWHPGARGEDGHFSLRAHARAPRPEEAEAAITDRDLLHALLETLPDMVYFKDLRSRFIRVSLAMARRDGHSDPSALIGRTDFDRMDAKQAQPRYADEQAIIRTGQPIVDSEEVVHGADGSETWLLTTKLPLRDRAGRVVGTCGVSRDITAHKAAERSRRELETQLQLAQKLESIGRLAAGSAHEINTPSQFITDNTRFLQDAFAQIRGHLAATGGPASGDGGHGNAVGSGNVAGAPLPPDELAYLMEEIPRTCAQSLEGLARIARIVRSLKEFAHPGSPDLRPADLNRCIENIIAVSRHEWKYVAEVVADLDRDLPLVPCVVDEFGQAVLNLIINASHAIEDAIKSGGAAQGVITVRTFSRDGGAVVEVGDTGTGVPPAIQQRIFEPFFTTKALGRGTGQGLAIVQKIIVQNHHGRIDFTTREGRGTTFSLWLPLTVAAAAGPANADSDSKAGSDAGAPAAGLLPRIAPP